MFIFFRKLRERVQLLEYENEELKRKVEYLEKETGHSAPPRLRHRMIREDGWDLSYDTLKKKYREEDLV